MPSVLRRNGIFLAIWRQLQRSDYIHVLSKKGAWTWCICYPFSYSFKLIVCLWFFVPLENFFSYGDVAIAGEGLHILTCVRHSWPLSSEGSLAFHAYCDTGHPFKMVISEDPWHSHLLPSVWHWSCRYLFLRIRSVAIWCVGERNLYRALTAMGWIEAVLSEGPPKSCHIQRARGTGT